MDRFKQCDYYAERANVSRDLARRATAPNIAAIHNDLASRYDALARRPEHREEPLSTSVQTNA